MQDGDRIDLVIRGAELYDGTGAPSRRADVALRDDRIVAVGEVGAAAGATRLDASGLALAPGFIDVHTHDDFAVVLHRDMSFKTLGGVTTCIVGNCGLGAAPFDLAWRVGRAFHPEGSLEPWQGYAGYVKRLDDAPPALNVGVLVGHGTMRGAVLGMESRAPDERELGRMTEILHEGLAAGALGWSSGLIYEPGRSATTDELVAIAREAAPCGIYATHMRDEGPGLLDSVDEAIAVGERAGVPVQISHHKASGRAAWGLVVESLKRIEAARARGVDVMADQYPYTAGSTVLAAVARAVSAAASDGGLGLVAPEDVVIASCAVRKDWEGKSIARLVEEAGRPLVETVEQILAEEPGATIIAHTMCEDDVRTVMRHPTTMIGSDGLPTLSGKPHPRLYGTFARVLGHYARSLGVLSLAEAVHRMSGLPARRFGLVDRGIVRSGARADLVLFDPRTVDDVATYEDPKRPPAGIAHVLVNGRFVVRDGAVTDARPGRVLRRG